jgi:hypothetical protein
MAKTTYRMAGAGLNTSQMGALLQAFKSGEGSAEERWAAAKKTFMHHDPAELDAGFKAWVFKMADIPITPPAPPPSPPAPKKDAGKKMPDPLK